MHNELTYFLAEFPRHPAGIMPLSQFRREFLAHLPQQSVPYWPRGRVVRELQAAGLTIEALGNVTTIRGLLPAAVTCAA